MVSSNNAINNTVGASISGVTNTLTVTNPSNTASSAARATVVVGGGTANDPTVNWNVSGVTNWEMGIDNSDSDKWKLSQGTALGTNDTIVSFTTGEVLKPRQPVFDAYTTVDLTNVTGDGTQYGPIIFDSTNFNVGSCYNTATGIFTAPVTGVYFFTMRLRMINFGAAHTDGIMGFFENGVSQPNVRLNWAAIRSSSPNNAIGMSTSDFAMLTAGQQYYSFLTISNGAKVITISAFSNATNAFSGVLLC